MNNPINVLIACEESQEVCKAFRELGAIAFSCDIQECSGGHPEWHIQGDCKMVIKPSGPSFVTQDGCEHFVNKWDLIIAHPPCTYLSLCGNRWFNVDKYGEKAVSRIREREKAKEFFMYFVGLDFVDHVAIENPLGVMSTSYRKPDQIIEPFHFGHRARKPTCLWLKGLPKLQPTNIVDEGEFVVFDSGRKMPKWYADLWNLKREERSRARSKTFEGIAKAMASQWFAYLGGNVWRN